VFTGTDGRVIGSFGLKPVPRESVTSATATQPTEDLQ
jgi:hypothetical protein